MKKHTLLALIGAALILLIGWWWLRPEPAAPGNSAKPGTLASRNRADSHSKSDEDLFDKSQFSTTDAASPWVIVNKQRPMSPQEYTPLDLADVGNGQRLRAEAAAAFAKMQSAARSNGLSIIAGSGYRSYATQIAVYDSEVRAYGQTIADSESARPGYSEHQTGWAIDISGGGCHIEDCFGSTPEGKWVAAHAADYGFIMRYTPANSAQTGYRAEPWHFRYVGIALAKRIAPDPSDSLESFFDISGGPNY
jgi:D-alanyl-D-alanine carboxypeptidase